MIKDIVDSENMSMILIYHYYIAGTFFPRAGALDHWLLRGHMTSNNRQQNGNVI